MCGKMFAEFVEDIFPNIFKEIYNPSGNAFVLDKDPCQNFKAAPLSVPKIGAIDFRISYCSPYLNPIENVFSLAERPMNSDVIRDKILKVEL